MIEFNLDRTVSATNPEGFAVSVVGIGGSGSNVLDRIALEGMPNAELICIASDVRVLNNSMANRKVQLGPKLTQGLGAGGDPELGLEAAQASEVEIRDLLKDKSMIFICMGLGGGTGSGAAPYIARLAREAGAFVVIFATLPFSFEGRRRQKQANLALEYLRQHANALITFENDRMGELVVPKKGIQEAFQLADRVIGQSVRAVTSLVTQPGLIRIGMDDLITALRNTDSRCLFGYGQAKGDNRALDALSLALKSPLLDRGQMLAKAQNVLVHVCGGANMSLFEIQSLMGELNKHVGEDAHLLFGAAVDPKLGDQISVTVLTSLGKPAATNTPAARETLVANPIAETAAPAPTNPRSTEQQPAVETRVATPAPALRPATIAREQPAPTPPLPGFMQDEEDEGEEIIEELQKSKYPSARPSPPTPAEDSQDEDTEEFHAPQLVRESPAAKQAAPAAPLDDQAPASPAPARKFAIRDVLNISPQGNTLKPRPTSNLKPSAEGASKVSASPFQPVRANITTPTSQEQQNFDERLQGNRGKFEKIEPTVEEGMDLDVPTFLRKKR